MVCLSTWFLIGAPIGLASGLTHREEPVLWFVFSCVLWPVQLFDWLAVWLEWGPDPDQYD